MVAPPGVAAERVKILREAGSLRPAPRASALQSLRKIELISNSGATVLPAPVGGSVYISSREINESHPS